MVERMHRSPEKNPKQWPVLLIASAANVLTVIDLWAVNIAYPAFLRAFAPATLSEVSWILNVYAILLAALLIPAGRLADSVGHKGSFLAGLTLFGLASLGCALAPSLALLIAGRLVQGMAAAVLIPTSLGFALSAFPKPERGTAVGIWAALGAVAASGGPILGGLLAAFSWRYIFLINVPLVAVAVAVGWRCLPSAGERSPRRIDARGAFLVFAAMSLLCTALVEASRWTLWQTSCVLGGGLLVAAALLAHVVRHPDPIVSPRLFVAPRFRVGALGIFAYYIGFAGMLLGLTLLLTDEWHLSVLGAALALSPGPLTAGILSPLSGRLSAWIGLRGMVLAGSVLFAATAALPLLTATSTPEYGRVVLPCLLLWGVANALLQPTLFATADSVPASELASGSAVLSMARQLGSAFGVALLVAVLAGDSGTPGLQRLRRVFVLVVATAAMEALAGLFAGNERPLMRSRGAFRRTADASRGMG
jgi:EmrB/QacA subfamily drug resistance transporter